MTADEFNEKWKNRLEDGHYGLAIDDENVTKYLNFIFELFEIAYPYFTYSQIKLKFGNARVYMSSITPPGINVFLEQRINEILAKNEK